MKELLTLLKEKGLTMSCAESCTGGMIAAAITDIPGSSDIFDRGFVTYSNAAKQDMLGVSTATLEQFGAVSIECAKEMVLGALQNSKADIAVAVTGIAGPTGGTKEKPVGLVYIALCSRSKKEPKIEECHFDGTRAQIRELTRDKAFNLLIKAVRAV